MLPDTRGKKLVLWIPCRSLARLVGCSYRSILNYSRVKWITAKEIGDHTAWIAMVPKKRALAEYRQLRRDGLIW